VIPDDFELPDPSEQTEEIVRPAGPRGFEWPFETRETILLALLYLAPFAIRWLNNP
jgi:hypothetical protein